MGDPVKVITGTAEYTCNAMGHRGITNVTREVTATVVEGDDPAAQLHLAAEALKLTIDGCPNASLLSVKGPTPEPAPATKDKSFGSRVVDVLAYMFRSYGNSMTECQEATGSYLLCKPMP